jgi:hypothetical protein
VTAEPQPEPEPDPAAMAETTGEPLVVTLDDETQTWLLWTCAVVSLGVGARVVGSFGGR